MWWWGLFCRACFYCVVVGFFFCLYFFIWDINACFFLLWTTFQYFPLNSLKNSHKSLPTGAASIGKGIGGILFSRFSRSNSQPSVSLGLEGGPNTEEEEQNRTESQSAYGLSSMIRPTSPTADTSCEFTHTYSSEWLFLSVKSGQLCKTVSRVSSNLGRNVSVLQWSWRGALTLSSGKDWWRVATGRLWPHTRATGAHMT